MFRPCLGAFLGALGLLLVACESDVVDPGDSVVFDWTEERIDAWLIQELVDRSFDGRIEEKLVEMLGRPIHEQRADLGRLLFFDPVASLTGDNSCSGCHGPNSAFNDANSIAIGVDNNGIVGPGRLGPHNQRRAPTIVNAVFYPSLMWDNRFEALSRDPFDNSRGYSFPEPEGLTLSGMEHLLVAQAFTPTVNRIEMAGAEFQGDNDAMRAEIVTRVSVIDEYQALFEQAFDDVAQGAEIRYEHIAAAIAEFEFTLVRADAPIDAYARGDHSSMSYTEKAGARLFFDESLCAECHIVRGFANQMFSDFEPHVLAVPQVVPVFGNKPFDGAANEDYGREQHSGLNSDRYKFRTSPLRNVVFQPTFMHNGAYLCLEEAVRHHLDAPGMLERYTTEGLDQGLQGPVGPYAEMLNRAQLRIAEPPILSETEILQIIQFLRISLTDPDAHPERLRALIPAAVPSGLPVHHFQFGAPQRTCSI